MQTLPIVNFLDESKNSTTLPRKKCEKAFSFQLSFFKAMGTRGVIGDKWSMRILWGCAIGSAVALYMVAVERQRQNRDQMMAESLKAMESEEINGEWDILSASTVLLDIGPVGEEKVPRPRKMKPVRMHSAEKRQQKH
uniref:Uncharacterized protein n=1 Tax=Gossypium raimondii TaxID=29730 RepID=A0A0D2R214_GOSRA|nr:hypothetical protein B456_002G072400 [Gossypium raimondii]